MLANPQEMTAVSANGDRQDPQRRLSEPEKGKRNFWAVLKANMGFCQFSTWAFAARNQDYARETAQNSIGHVKIRSQKLQNRPELGRVAHERAANRPELGRVTHERAVKRPALGRSRANKARNRAVNRPKQANPITVPVPPAGSGAPLLTVALNRGNIGLRRACQLLR